MFRKNSAIARSPSGRLSRSALVFVLIFGILWCTPSRAIDLLNDTWADGDRTSVNLPSDSPTWIGQSTGNGSNSVSTGSLNFTLPTSSLKIWEFFTANGAEPDGNQPHNAVTHLNVGDTLTAAVTFQVDGVTTTVGNNSKSFRLGLFFDPTDARVQTNVNSDGGGTTNPWADALGYALQFPINGSTSGSNPLQIGKRTTSNTSLLGQAGAFTFAANGGSAFSIANTTSYTAQLALNVVSASQLDVTATILQEGTVLSTLVRSDTGDAFGGTAIASGLLTGSQGIYLDFDQLFIRNSNSDQATNMNFTNFKVTVSQGLPAVLKGDFNLDNHVDSADISAMLTALADLNKYRAEHSLAVDDNAFKQVADVNTDGVVDNQDLQALLTLLASGGGSIAAVPEPTSAMLSVLGAAVVGFAARRKRNRWRASLHILSIGLVLTTMILGSSTSLRAEEKTITTSHGKGADAELRENDNAARPDTGKTSGASGELNCRFNNGLNPESKGQRNEVIALRFDLTGVDRAKIAKAKLQLIAHRDFPNDSGGGLQVYGVKPGAEKDWDDDGVKFSTMPGLKWDGNPKTRSLNEEDTVSLGKLKWLKTPPPKKAAELTYDDPALTKFLQSGGNLVTIILMQDEPRNVQIRIASKEAETLDGGEPKGKLGEFAQRLMFEVQP